MSQTKQPRPASDPEAVARARGDIFARSRVNREGRKLLAQLRKLQRTLEVYELNTAEDLHSLWSQAGLPPVDEDDADAEGWIAAAEYMVEESTGFQWCLNHILDVLEANVIDQRWIDGRRRRARRLASK